MFPRGGPVETDSFSSRLSSFSLSLSLSLYMARRDGEQRSAVLQQHFIAQRRDKSWPNGVADFPKIISQNFDFLQARSVDFDEKRTKWKQDMVV